MKLKPATPDGQPRAVGIVNISSPSYMNRIGRSILTSTLENGATNFLYWSEYDYSDKMYVSDLATKVIDHLRSFRRRFTPEFQMLESLSANDRRIASRLIRRGLDIDFGSRTNRFAAFLSLDSLRPEDIAELPRLPVSQMSLPGNSSSGNLRLLPSIPSLRDLRFSGEPDQQFSILANALRGDSFHPIESVIIENINLTTDHLLVLATWRSLTNLSLDGMDLRAVDVSTLRSSSTLSHLQLKSTRLGEDSFAESSRNSITDLRVADWYGDLDLLPAVAKAFPQLRSLTLTQRLPVEPNPFQHAAASLADLRALEEVHVHGAHSGALVLAEMLKLPQLHHLTIPGRLVELKDLTSLYKHPALTELTLLNSEVSDEALRSSLLPHWPNVQIIRETTDSVTIRRRP